MKLPFIVCGLVFLALIWAPILQRWQRGLFWLMVYIPYAGVFVLLTNHSAAALLAKDILFLAPAYLSFSYSKLKEGGIFNGIPQFVIVNIYLFAILVIMQTFNPAVYNYGVALIGTKVWLLYVPLLFVAYAYSENYLQLVKLLRVVAVTAWIPCCLGITQWVLSGIFGYQRTMKFFYGAKAAAVTQDFTSFKFEGEFNRIPSTFSFSAQYGSYLLALPYFCYILCALDPKGFWRTFGRATFFLSLIASFMCGTRAMLVLVPVTITMMLALDQGIRGALKLVVLFIALLAVIQSTAGYNLGTAAFKVFDMVPKYGEDLAVHGIRVAIELAPFGYGTGMNTSAARYMMKAPGEINIGVENWYAKSIMELGIFGGLLVFILHCTNLGVCLSAFMRTKDKRIRSSSAALFVYFFFTIFDCSKGQRLDQDPLNVYYWIFAGIAYRMYAQTQTYALMPQRRQMRRVKKAPPPEPPAEGENAEGEDTEKAPAPT